MNRQEKLIIVKFVTVFVFHKLNIEKLTCDSETIGPCRVKRIFLQHAMTFLSSKTKPKIYLI